MSQPVLLYNHSLTHAYGCWVDDRVFHFGPRQMLQVAPELAKRILEYAAANEIPVSADLPDVVVINGRQYVPIEKIMQQSQPRDGAEAARLAHTQEAAGSNPAPATNSPASSDIDATTTTTQPKPKGKQK